MEVNWNEVYGLTEEGGEVQEVAEPAEMEPEAEGAEAQEVAEPAEGDDPVPAGDSADEEEGGERPAEEKKTEEDAAYAAARRQAEKQLRQKLDKDISNCGFIDPYTGKKVESLAELREFAKTAQRQRTDELRERSGLSQEELDTLVQNMPEVREARELAEEAKQEKLQRRLQEDLAEVTKLSGSIRTMEELAADPKFPEIRERVRGGMSIPDAYKLTYHDEIVQKAAERARATARQNAAGKSHMTRTGEPVGQADSAVPPEVMREYRRFNPTATAEEIHRHWNRTMKK